MKEPSRSKRLLGGLLVALFGLPFLGAGLFVGWLALGLVVDWVDASDWVEVPARIVDLELESHRGDDSTTYRVRARYSYEFEGESFEGNRVALTSVADNIGSFQKDRHRELSAARSERADVPCFVDPEAPERSILFRQMRWGLLGLMGIFSTLFTGVGGAVFFGAFLARRKGEAKEELRQRHPEQPWLHDERWSSGRIRSTARSRVRSAIIFALFWNLVSAPLFFVIPDEVRGGNHLALIGAIFPLVGAWLVLRAVVAVLRKRRYGESVFEMDSVPGVIGGRLAGRVRVGGSGGEMNRAPEIEELTLTLTCVERSKHRSGNRTEVRETALWQDSYRVSGSSYAYRSGPLVIPVDFAIPWGVRASDVDASEEGIVWRLEVKAKARGVDLDESFELPVFVTGRSREEFDARSARDETASREPSIVRDLDFGEAGIDVGPAAGGGTRYVFRAARHPGPAMGLTLFTLFWCGAVVLMWRFSVPLFFPIVFGAFGVLMLFGVVDLWLGKHVVEVDSSRLVYRGGPLALGRTREIEIPEIVEIEAIPGMRSGSKLYHRVQARTRDGRVHLLASKLDSLALAERVVEQLQR